MSPPDCTKRFIDAETGLELSYGDCGSEFAPFYFLSFIVVCKFTMINLFVGMIINNFSFCSNKGIISVITPRHIDDLVSSHFCNNDNHHDSCHSYEYLKYVVGT